LEAKERELAALEERGDLQLAATLGAEVTYMKGQGTHSQRERIKREREAASQELCNALATELDKQADELESKVPAQRAKEDKALAHLEEVSGCKWQPERPTMGTIGGALRVVVVHIPLSKQFQNGAERRRGVAGHLRAVNPLHRVLADSLINEALGLVKQ
jgi:hypothetical protein